MGKGSNVQKAQQARERNAKKLGKTDEERKAASAKAAADAKAKQCVLCLQTFMISSRPPLLYQHVTSKHPECATCPEKCFDELIGFDPDDPKGEKAAAKEKAEAAKKAAAKKKKAGGGADLDALLDAGLTKAKKK